MPKDIDLSESDKMVFLECVKGYMNIIENKTNDAMIIKRNTNAWKELIFYLFFLQIFRSLK